MKKNILITGGTSGIGKGVAEYFYKKGWNVLVTGRNKNKLDAFRRELPDIHVLPYNNLEEEQLHTLIDFIETQWNGNLDILINNAGHVEIGPLSNLTKASMEKMFQAHLIGPSILTSKCLGFLKNTKGQIMNISSSHGIKPHALTSSYGSAKAALNMITKIWALELAPLGIRVNAVAPGPTETDILKSAGYDDAMIDKIHKSEIHSIPLKKRGSVEDVVVNITSILDSGSTWTTGVLLPTDGGISIS